MLIVILCSFSWLVVGLGCKWKSYSGATFDLSPLHVATTSAPYYIKDGDIPCTPELEPTYSYLWNFCDDVTSSSKLFPLGVCTSAQSGAVIQYLNRTSDGYKECNVVGRYDSNNDKNDYSLMDSNDPSKGVSMKYSSGDKCTGDVLRSATIDVVCDNVKSIVESALEPSYCQYHMVMRSYYGCPTECPITSNGLCNSHGHCAYDYNSKKAYCYCNEGYTGDSCTTRGSSSGSSVSSTQIGLLVTLLIVTIGLVGVVGYMVYRITKYRKEQLDYSALSMQGTEMVETF